jgi:hypothetical protein
MEFISFPSINQFRNVIRQVVDRVQYNGRDAEGKPIFHQQTMPRPTLKYRGTVKMHGTNAGVVVDVKTGEKFYQSRERQLSLVADNYGFMVYMSSKVTQVDAIVSAILAQQNDNPRGRPTAVAIFGEWCGGSIQSGVAIGQVAKMFCIFAVKLVYEGDQDDENNHEWIDITTIKGVEFPEDRIFNILRFGHWELDIDFERPEVFQNHLVETTISVETACPAGLHFGVEGVGEGVVWECVTEGWRRSGMRFKVKGEKHSVSKVKTLAAVDVEAIKAVEDFVEMAVTEARLEQGLRNLVDEQQKPFEMKSLGDFIRWVYNDIVKEETDTIVANQLDVKKLGGPISNKARRWYIDRLNKLPV